MLQLPQLAVIEPWPLPKSIRDLSLCVCSTHCLFKNRLRVGGSSHQLRQYRKRKVVPWPSWVVAQALFRVTGPNWTTLRVHALRKREIKP